MSIISDSLITRLGLFFALMLLLINLLMIVEHRYRIRHDYEARIERFFHTTTHLMRDTNLTAFRLRHATFTAKQLEQKGQMVHRERFGALYHYDGREFFVGCRPPKPKHMGELPPPMKQRPRPEHHSGPDRPHHEMSQGDCIVFESLEHQTDLPFWLLLAGSNVMLILFFTYFIRKLLPLHRLESAIANLDDRYDSEPLHVEGDDEISRIAAQYNRVRQRLRTMQEARTLFLRNILHELNTPFMKGRLLSDYISEPSLKQRFERLFERMEFVLRELGQIERLTSGTWELDCHPYRLGDLYAHAYDLLLRDETRIILEGDASKIVTADFEYFAIALKNLIDNALRYSEEEVVVRFTEQETAIISHGAPLDLAPDAFTRPFNRSFEGGGLGLGLYITHTVAERHGFALQYRYKEGLNCFAIRYTHQE